MTENILEWTILNYWQCIGLNVWADEALYLFAVVIELLNEWINPAGDPWPFAHQPTEFWLSDYFKVLLVDWCHECRAAQRSVSAEVADQSRHIGITYEGRFIHTGDRSWSCLMVNCVNWKMRVTDKLGWRTRLNLFVMCSTTALNSAETMTYLDSRLSKCFSWV